MCAAINGRASGAACILVCVATLLAACGGGGGTAQITFSVTGVNPTVSVDLNGGDRVTVFGSNFVTVQVVSVRFGGSPATNLQVLDENTLQVTTPPAPGGAAGTVGIEVISLDAGGQILFDAYTYVSPNVIPNPQTITPTLFTATGAETFTIGGTTLGQPGGTVSVQFVGVGTVSAQVSQDGKLATGNAPVSPGPPPPGPLTVRVDTGTAQADVPTPVQYAWAGPTAFGMPGQTAGNASQPVALAPGFGVLCVAGQNNLWGDADDEVMLIQGPPSPVVVTAVRRSNGMPVGFLNRFNSIPAVLDANNFCVYSLGPNGAPGGGDDLVVQVSSAQTTPIVANHPGGNLNTAPLQAISSTRIATTEAGADGLRNTVDDLLLVMTFTGTTSQSTFSPAPVGPIDPTAGPGNLSLPFSPDGDSVFVLTGGGNTTLLDADDALVRFTLSSGIQRGVNMPFLQRRPVAVSANTAAAPAAGPDTILGTPDDVLLVANDPGPGFVTAPLPLGAPLDLAAVVTMERLGAKGLVVPLTNGSLAVVTDPANGVIVSLPHQGTPLLAGLGSGAMLIFGPGPDNFPSSGDETLIHLDAAATTTRNMVFVPNWNQAFKPLTGADRAFEVGFGGDGAPGTGDEMLIVHQSRALGATVDGSLLPLALAPASAIPANTPFVPIGPGWGVAQSPGPDRLFGSLDDQLVIAQY